MPVLASILPAAWFVGLPQVALFLILAAAVAAVVKGADWLVESAATGAARLGMPKVVIGATIVALGTTCPEAAVSVVAAWNGDAGLALGNGVGSVLADTGLIFGIGCLLCALPADRFVLRRQGWVQFGAAALLAGACYVFWFAQNDHAALPRWFGYLLLALLGGYMFLSVRWARQHSDLARALEQGAEAGEDTGEAAEEDQAEGADHEADHGGRSAAGLVFRGLVGLALVVVGGDVLVTTAAQLAQRWGVPEVVVAGSLVAFGTSLPELVVGMTAIRKGHPELLVGNIIGADILNVLFVIGAALVAARLPIVAPASARPAIFLELHLPVMLVMLGLFRLLIVKAGREGAFRRWMGAPLLGLYVAYVVLSYVLSVGPAH